MTSFALTEFDEAVAFVTIGKTDTVDEHSSWEEKTVCKALVHPLGSVEVVSCLAAFLVKYERRKIELYFQFKRKMVDFFENSLILAKLFTDSNFEETNMLIKIIMPILAETLLDNPLGPGKMRIRKFLRLAHQ